MLGISTLLTLIIIAIAVWIWQLQSKAKELAIHASKNACKNQNIQFLDGTVNFLKFTFKRHQMGPVGLIRHYRFDYYNGEGRYHGYIDIFKNQVIKLQLSSEKNNKTRSYKASNDKSSNKNDKVIPFPKTNRKQQNPFD